MEILRMIFALACGTAAALVLLFGAYLSACAGAERWLTFSEWWGQS